MLGELRAQFDAVFLGLDSRTARPLRVPGAEVRGVMQALPFILQKNTPVALELPPVDLSGNRVVVVEGYGHKDLAPHSVARAREVVCTYRRDQTRCLARRMSFRMLWKRVANSFSKPDLIEVLSTPDGQVKAPPACSHYSCCQRVRRPHLRYIPQPGEEFDLEANWVILALGFNPLACPHSGSAGELSVNEWGGLVVDGRQMADIAGVFAGGDLVRGPSLVLHTVQDGRNATTASTLTSPQRSRHGVELPG